MKKHRESEDIESERADLEEVVTKLRGQLNDLERIDLERKDLETKVKALEAELIAQVTC